MVLHFTCIGAVLPNDHFCAIHFVAVVLKTSFMLSIVKSKKKPSCIKQESLVKLWDLKLWYNTIWELFALKTQSTSIHKKWLMQPMYV